MYKYKYIDYIQLWEKNVTLLQSPLSPHLMLNDAARDWIFH